MAFLEVKNLHKSFGDIEVLKGVNLELNKGEVLAVIGSSGGGKTTLLRCIAFLERGDVGEITLDGATVFSADASAKNKKPASGLGIGMVFQSFNLFPHFNVKKNLTLAARLQYNKTVKNSFRTLLNGEARRNRKAGYRAIDMRALELLRRVGLEDKSNAYPCELSGGQQQRVAIARALMNEPSVLCFDEPTSALDPELTQEVLRVINDLKNEGYTMIVVTHEMEFAKSIADRVVFIADGNIEECGAPTEIFGNPQSQKTRAFLANIMYGKESVYEARPYE